MCHVLWTEAYLRRQGDEEQAEVSGWLLIQGLDDVWVWAAAEAQVWARGSDATAVSVDVWLLILPKAQRTGL